MREPVWITDLCFLDKKGDHSKIVVGTGKHQLRMYDVRNGSGSKSKSSNDRPCMNVVVREPQSCTNRGANPIRQICSSGDGNIVYFADSVGQVGQFDLRNQKTVNVYKGPAGSVTGLTSFGNRIAAVGLDRFLHVWDATKGAVVQKVYLKQKLSCVLIDEEFVAASVAGEKREAEEEEETRDDNDDIFSRMEKAVR
jgi:ribosome biogenesis protein NSA1